MSLLNILRWSRIGENIIFPAQYAIQTKTFAQVKTEKKAKTVKEKIHIPVEKDINKLLTYVCGSNIYKEGEDIKLKPDSEYPDWLWDIRTEPPQLADLDPNTKKYWRYIRKFAIKRKNLQLKYLRV